MKHLLKRLEDFLKLVDPDRANQAEDLILDFENESALFDYLEHEYGSYFLTLEASKPVCKYGKDCYRKNPDHLKEFSHPGR